MLIKQKNLKLIKRLIVLFVMLLITATLSAPIMGMAYVNNNYSYTFNIPVGGRGHCTTSKYRSTTNIQNTWKVNMSYSDEPTKAHPDGSTQTASKFLLGAKKDGDKYYSTASSLYTVLEGSGNHYYPTKSNASKADTRLYAEDNGGATSEYTVKGTWDEETGKIYGEDV
ncbi:MAG: DUF2712 domain-containing protein [Eubacterium sp.]